MKNNNSIKIRSLLIMIVIIFAVLNIVLFLLNYKVLMKSSSKTATITMTEGEFCMQCHKPMTGFSEHHDPQIIGCTSCHLGDPDHKSKSKAHEGMILIPGNLSDARQTCGKCHTAELNKIENSIMTTNSGIVAVDKVIFGESDNFDEHYHIADIGFSTSEKHIRDLCANCHLGAEKTEYGAITQMSRGGGCNACHLNYSEEAKNDLEKYIASNNKDLPLVHPSTDIFVNDNHCFGCHSRSGRISTNYIGLQETVLSPEDAEGDNAYAVMEDERVYKILEEDAHHSKGLLCIDCHSSHEVMGDGKIYAHKEDAVSIHCSDCHFKNKPNTIPYDSLDDESFLVFFHRDYEHKESEIIITEKNGNPLVNTYVNTEGNAFLIGKGDGALHPLTPQPLECSGDLAHANVSCSSCHSSWAPKCIGCHNQFDPTEKEGYDLLDKKDVAGQWKEYIAEFSSSLPGLGVREHDGEDIIEPAIPGMILTIDRGSYIGNPGEDILFHRLFSPSSPHTIVKEVRDCKSCHTNPYVIGYGNGSLTYLTKENVGEWIFNPEYADNENDGLPEDAWIPFLKEIDENELHSTRNNFRPFSLDEQKQILKVGACLQCHESGSGVMRRALVEGLAPVLRDLTSECILPEE